MNQAQSISRNRKLAWGIPLLLILLFTYSRYSWEWSVMDDPGYVLRLQQSIAETGGTFSGILYNFRQHRAVDTVGGIFRPAFWAYTSTVYLLPPNWAYTSRLLTFLLIFFFCIDATLRVRGHRLLCPESWGTDEKWLVFFQLTGFLSIRSLYDGLALVVLQELIGIFFASLGIWLISVFEKKSTGLAESLATLSFLATALVKPPFAWMLFFLGVSNLFRRRYFWAAVQIVLFATVLGIASQWASRGAYSHAIYQFRLENFFLTLMSFAKHGAMPALVVALAALFWHQQISAGSLLSPSFARWRTARWMGLVFLFSGVLYLGTMLPRGITGGVGYYMSPIIFFLVVGCLLMIDDCRETKDVTGRKTIAIGVLALASATVIFSFSIYKMWNRNEAVRGLRDWALTLPSSGLVLAGNSREVSASFQQILQMRSSGGWKNTFYSLTDKDDLPTALDYYIVFSDQASPNPLAQETLLFRVGSASVYRTK
jgi:hypothetical protein